MPVILIPFVIFGFTAKLMSRKYIFQDPTVHSKTTETLDELLDQMLQNMSQYIDGSSQLDEVNKTIKKRAVIS